MEKKHVKAFQEFIAIEGGKEKAGKAQPISNLRNVLDLLRSMYPTAFRFDEMGCTVMLAEPLVPTAKPRMISDTDVSMVQVEVQKLGLERASKDMVHQAVDIIAHENAYHPVRDYLDALQWDGQHRVDRFLTDYFGCEDTDYVSAVGRMFLIAMVARIYQPGCQADYMLILEDRSQGTEKSKACRVFGGEWFHDQLPDLSVSGGKEASQHLRGKWLIELAELHTLNKAEVAQMKAFITRRVEVFRPPFGRREVIEPRQSVFIGTTNEYVYLKDESGNRRYWGVTTGTIKVDQLQADRDQLFAEAVHLYRNGAQWWPTREFEREHIVPEQQRRCIEDDWFDPVGQYLTLQQEKTTIGDVLRHALNIEAERHSREHQNRVSKILAALDWEKQKKDRYGRTYWTKPGVQVAAGL